MPATAESTQGIATLIRALDNALACCADLEDDEALPPDVQAARMRIIEASPVTDREALHEALDRFCRAAIAYHAMLLDPDPFLDEHTLARRHSRAANRLDAARRALCHIADPDGLLRRRAG